MDKEFNEYIPNIKLVRALNRQFDSDFNTQTFSEQDFETYLCVLAVTFVVLSSILKAYLYNKSIPETISAVDFCYALFEIFFLIGLAIISINTLVANIGFFAVLLTSAVLTLYKVYYTFRYTDLISKIKNLFTRK